MLKLTTLPRVFHARRLSIQLSCLRNPALVGVSPGSRDSDSASCPYRRSSFTTPAAQAAVLYGGVSMSTRPAP